MEPGEVMVLALLGRQAHRGQADREEADQEGDFHRADRAMGEVVVMEEGRDEATQGRGTSLLKQATHDKMVMGGVRA